MSRTKLVVFSLIVFAMLGFAPPSGRPPVGALKREDPKKYNFTFEVLVDTLHQRDARYKQSYNLRDAPVVLPLIMQNTFSQIDHETLKARLWLGSMEDNSVMKRSRLDESAPHHTQLAKFTIGEFAGQSVRWQMSFDVTVWDSVVDEAAVAKIPWPQSFPDEVADGLRSQMYIESDDQFFKNAVQNVSEGNLRMVPPYLAAKDLVRYCTNNIQVRGDGVELGRFEVLHGLEVQGALKTVQTGLGSPHDLVCVCIAMLRAAGIPARPVIGVQERSNQTDTFVSWGEFYLPETGWIPFDPNELRGNGIRTKDVREPWSDFGTIKNLNQRIPVSFFFVPPAGVESPQYPALWGWDPRPGRDPGTIQQIKFQIISRGTPN